MTEPLSVRALAAAKLMNSGAKLEDFAHLDVTRPGMPTRQPEVPAAEPEQQPGWDMAAFEGLTPEVKAAVQAGSATVLGRGLLELEAERQLNSPQDVHLYLTNPGSYVNGEGRVDRSAIAADVAKLVADKPHLARHGLGAGQVPPERRQAPPGVGAGGGLTYSLADRVAAVSQQMQHRH